MAEVTPRAMRMVVKIKELSREWCVVGSDERQCCAFGYTSDWGEGRTKREHGQQNLDSEITASVTICQVRNKDCGLNALQGSLASESAD
jgi:hypothetical protein